MLQRLFLLLLLAAQVMFPQQPIGQFFKDTFEGMLRLNPELATGYGRHEYDDRWSNWSPAGRAARRQFYESRLQTLKGWPDADLSSSDRLTVKLVKYDFQSRLDAMDLEDYILRVGQLFGFHNRIYLTIDRMPARTPHDFENILARLRAVPTYVDQSIGVMNEAIERKMMQSQTVTNAVARQLAAQVAQDAEHTALLEPFRKMPSNIPAAEQQRLRSEAKEIYEKQFLPSWRKLQQFMNTTYMQNVRPADSLSSIPGGKEAYAILVRRLTTTNFSPEAIHETGEKEVKRIETEMQAIAAKTGFTGTLTEFQTTLSNDPAQRFHSKEEMLAYCRNIAKIIEPELPNQFRHIPMLLYGVRPIPADREAGTATNAQAPSPDFTVPGWFNLNTYEPEKQVKYDKESLVLHEAVPGHVFQITLAQSQQQLPDIRKFYGNSAFAEGWALYAESLGSQLGMYRDPYSRFGQLASERFRAVRLVVDTGIHYYGWTREQAVDYFKTHAPEESLAEVDRYISWPAQALSYKMGQLQILELRRKAEQELGPKFDVREFHDVVLRDGTLPLDLLKEVVNEYIAKVK
jgi:prolyl oligopeptidase